MIQEGDWETFPEFALASNFRLSRLAAKYNPAPTKL